jgi:hypothetical protein
MPTRRLHASCHTTSATASRASPSVCYDARSTPFSCLSTPPGLAALRGRAEVHLLNDPADQYWLSRPISSTSCPQAQSCPDPSEQHHLREAVVWSLVTAGMKARRPGSGTGSDVCRRGQGDDFYGLAFRQALILFKVSLFCLEMRVFQQCRCSPR